MNFTKKHDDANQDTELSYACKVAQSNLCQGCQSFLLNLPPLLKSLRPHAVHFI